MVKMVLLIVDNQQESCQTLESLFCAHGYTVKTASNGKEALSMVDDTIEGVISEVLMPVMDGIELHRKIDKRVPFIFVTNYLEKRDAPLISALGAHLVEKSDLSQVVQQVIPLLGSVPEISPGFKEYYKISQRVVYRTQDTLETMKKELSHSEAKYKQLFEGSHDATFILSSTGTHIEANKKAAILLGYTQEELQNMSFRSIVHPEDASDSEEKIKMLLKGEEIPLYEKRVVHKEGGTIPVEISVSGIPDESGHVKYIQSIVRDITTRKKAEEKLSQLHQFLQQVIDDANVWLDVLDTECNVLIWNKAAEEISGYSKEEVVGHKKIWAWLYPDKKYQKKITDKAQAIIEKGEEVKDFETTICCRNGEYRIISWNSRNLQNDQGECIGSIALGKDVTERKKAEEKLKESEEKYKAIIEAAPDGMAAMDLKGIVTSCNSAFLDLTGFSKDDIVGKHMTRLPTVRAKDIPYYIKLFANMVKGKLSMPVEFQWVHKDGDIRWGEVHATLLKQKGKITGVHIIARDITERKKTEKELQEYRQHLEELVEERTKELGTANQKLQQEISEREQAESFLAAEKERLAVTLRSIGDGVITTNTKGIIVLINKKAEVLTGYTQKEAVGKPLDAIFTIVSEETRDPCESPVEKVLNQGAVVGLGNNTVLIAKDGTERIIADSGAPIRDINSVIIGVVLVFRDITEKRKMEQDLLKAQKLESLGILAGGIAHDFNNILTAVLNNVALARVYTVHDKVKEKLTQIEKASLQATDLTQQLLTFSKGGAPVKKSMSIAELIKDSTQLALRGSNVKYYFDVPRDIWSVHVDKGQISQVINNIVINANQAMLEGGVIHVKAENVFVDTEIPVHPGEYVKISITDEGVGIPPEDIPKVFDPYFSTKKTGSGLGLATSYSIVKQHNGYIDITSELGEGATVCIWLPRAGSVYQVKEPEAQTVSGTGKVLLMDDEETILETACEVLQYLGYTVECAHHGREAIDAYENCLDTEPFDVVIMDLTIPGGMGGEETIKELLQIDPHVTAIVSSGYSNDPVMADYKRYGFKGVVTKPYIIEELSKTLNSVLQ
jgi:PAS domain S-box-containing protein